MPRLDIGRISLRELGELVGVQVEASVEEREGFDRFFDVPLRMLERQFRSSASFRSFVLRKLEQAEDRARTLRIAAIFSIQP